MNNKVVRFMSRTDCYNHPCILAKQRIRKNAYQLLRSLSFQKFQERCKTVIFPRIPAHITDNTVKVLSQSVYRTRSDQISISGNTFIEDDNIGDITTYYRSDNRVSMKFNKINWRI